MAAEAKLEKQLTDWCKKRGIYTRKFSSPSNRGVPDRIYVHKGKVVFLELKAKGKKPTALQLRELKLLRDQQVAATYADNFELATSLLELHFQI